MNGDLLTRIIELTKTKDKRVGLRMLYKEFNIKDGEIRGILRDLWGSIERDFRNEKTN